MKDWKTLKKELLKDKVVKKEYDRLAEKLRIGKERFKRKIKI